MPWWIWVVVGFALLVAESIAPAEFYLAFIGLAALGTGLVVVAVGMVPLWVHLSLFSAIAVVSLVFMRKPMIRRLGTTGGSSGVGSERLIGDVAVLMAELPPGGIGKGELRGTVWTVRSESDRPLGRGERCRVQRVDGLTLWVVPEDESRDPEKHKKVGLDSPGV